MMTDSKYVMMIKRFFGGAVFVLGGSLFMILLVLLGIFYALTCVTLELTDGLLKKIARS